MSEFQKGNHNEYNYILSGDIITKVESLMKSMIPFTNDAGLYANISSDTLKRDIVSRLIVDRCLSECKVDTAIIINVSSTDRVYCMEINISKFDGIKGAIYNYS